MRNIILTNIADNLWKNIQNKVVDDLINEDTELIDFDLKVRDSINIIKIFFIESEIIKSYKYE